MIYHFLYKVVAMDAINCLLRTSAPTPRPHDLFEGLSAGSSVLVRSSGSRRQAAGRRNRARNGFSTMYKGFRRNEVKPGLRLCPHPGYIMVNNLFYAVSD